MQPFSIFIIGLLFTANAMSQPTISLDELPASLKTQATVIVLAKYKSYRGSCTPYRTKEGKTGRRWRIYYGFETNKVIKGQIKPGILQIHPHNLPKNTPYLSIPLQNNRYYWVLLAPTTRRQAILISKNTGFGNTISAKEIVAIMPVKNDN